jgi:hypothetical protein
MPDAIPTGRNGFAVPTGAERVLRQKAPYPDVLETLVGRLRYKPGWQLWLAGIDRGQGCEGLTLVIRITTPDSYHPDRTIVVDHYMIVDAAAYDERAWRRWLLERILLVEQHEACEFFRLVGPDGTETRPWAPSHGPGNDPYMIREPDGTVVDQRTSFRGEVTP